MAIEIKMPALSPTMEEGTLSKWLVKEGDEVSSGDILAEIETDKATMEFEAVDEGTITKITVAEGTDGVKVGTVIAVMSSGDERDAEGSDADSSTEPEQASDEEPEENSDSGTECEAEDAAEITEEAPAAKGSRADDPDVPEGTAMVTITG